MEIAFTRSADDGTSSLYVSDGTEAGTVALAYTAGTLAAAVAYAAVFLASEQAQWITGETISIDGGRHLTCAR